MLTDLEKAKGFGHDPAILIGEAIASNWVGCVFKDRHFQPAPAAPGGGRIRRESGITVPVTPQGAEFEALLRNLSRPALEGELAHASH
ncbi:MAG: hypothetical protein WAT67_07910 [Candidatus Contendobacter sp.]